MQRRDYEADADVQSFVQWATRLVTGERALRQSWTSPKWGSWWCDSLLDAYCGFDWPFSVTLPGESKRTRGRSFEENVRVLDRLSGLLRSGAKQRDTATFRAAAIAVVDWGGVPRNRQRLLELGDSILPTILAAARQLDPAHANLTQLDDVRYMNSGFSKIYSLLLDGFPIYDSRVACALASLLKLYCLKKGRQCVPPALVFGIPPNHGQTRRNPSEGTLRFPPVRPGDPGGYAASNLKAAWLIGLLSEKGRFGEMGRARGLLALQSALFMIGYEPLKQQP